MSKSSNINTVWKMALILGMFGQGCISPTEITVPSEETTEGEEVIEVAELCNSNEDCREGYSCGPLPNNALIKGFIGQCVRNEGEEGSGSGEGGEGATVCLAVVEEVCDVDTGITYSNRCEAEKAQATNIFDGSCATICFPTWEESIENQGI